MRASFCLLFLPVAAIGASPVPEAPDRERYRETLAASPFALATPAPPLPAREVDPLAGMVLAGLAKLDDGSDFVVVTRPGTTTSLTFEGTLPNAEGIMVRRVNWGHPWTRSSVILSNGATERLIKFDEAAGKKPLVPPRGEGRVAPPPGRGGTGPR